MLKVLSHEILGPRGQRVQGGSIQGLCNSGMEGVLSAIFWEPADPMGTGRIWEDAQRRVDFC